MRPTRPVRATLRATAGTPPFRVKGSVGVGYINRDNATVFPRFLVLFNANVDAAAAPENISATSMPLGPASPARVEQADDPKKRDRNFPGLAKRRPLTRDLGRETRTTDRHRTTTKIQRQRIEQMLRPSPTPRAATSFTSSRTKPLPPGAGWRLVVDAGLPAAKANSNYRQARKSRSAPSSPSTSSV